MEGAIPAKGKAFGDSGGVGRGDTREQKQNAGGARGLGELYPRFRDADRPQQGAHGPLNAPPSNAKSAVQARQGAPAAKLSEPARNIAALLPGGHPAEDDEAASGKRLAARFVRRPGDEARACARGGSAMPYVAAGAFVLLAAGGAALYFLRPENSGPTERAGSAYVPASFTAPYEAGPGPQAQTAPPWTPQSSGAGAAQGADPDSWAQAVETFRTLAVSGAATPQGKANERPPE